MNRCKEAEGGQRAALTGEDLERIWEVLSKYTDRDGNHPVMTADYAVANPDFARIEASGLESYFWEPFPETAKRYPGSENLLELCRQGMEAGVWKPQLHCREHVQVPGWMKALRQRDPAISIIAPGAWTRHPASRRRPWPGPRSWSR